jgi:hypothetical protein
LAETGKKEKENGARQQTAPRRFAFWAVFKKIVFVLLGIYIFIDSFNAGFHPHRVPDMLRSTAKIFATPSILRLQPYDSMTARIELLRTLNRLYPKGTPLSKVQIELSAQGFDIHSYQAVYIASNFICKIRYTVTWTLDAQKETIIKFGGGANMKCGFNL